MATETFSIESVSATELRGRKPDVIPLNEDTDHIFALNRFRLPTFFERIKWKGGTYDINFRNLYGAQTWIKEDLPNTRIEEGWPSDRVSFKSKEDFMAFKLRWM